MNFLAVKNCLLSTSLSATTLNHYLRITAFKRAGKKSWNFSPYHFKALGHLYYVGFLSLNLLTTYLDSREKRSFDPHNSCYNTSHSPYYSPNSSLKGGHRVISGMRPRSLIQSKSHAFDSRIQKKICCIECTLKAIRHTLKRPEKSKQWVRKSTQYRKSISPLKKLVFMQIIVFKVT